MCNIAAVLVLLVGIAAASRDGFLLLLMAAYVIPLLLFLYVISRVLLAVVRWLER